MGLSLWQPTAASTLFCPFSRDSRTGQRTDLLPGRGTLGPGQCPGVSLSSEMPGTCRLGLSRRTCPGSSWRHHRPVRHQIPPAAHPGPRPPTELRQEALPPHPTQPRRPSCYKKARQGKGHTSACQTGHPPPTDFAGVMGSLIKGKQGIQKSTCGLRVPLGKRGPCQPRAERGARCHAQSILS